MGINLLTLMLGSTFGQYISKVLDRVGIRALCRPVDTGWLCSVLCSGTSVILKWERAFPNLMPQS